MTQRNLSPASVMKALGISPKALRHYESLGLVTPGRTEAGWRVFAPVDVARLYQILALKGLGLPLTRIRLILTNEHAHAGSSMSEILEMQTVAMQQQRDRAASALELIRRAQDLLRSGSELTTSDLVRLGQQTGVTQTADLGQRMQPFYQRHLTPEEQQRTQPAILDFWKGMIAEAQRLLEAGEAPGSAAADDLMRRWLAAVRIFTGGDLDVEAKYDAAMADAVNEARDSSWSISRELWTYLKASARELNDR